MSPAMIPHSVRNWLDFNRPLMVRLLSMEGRVCGDAGLHNFSAALP